MDLVMFKIFGFAFETYTFIEILANVMNLNANLEIPVYLKCHKATRSNKTLEKTT